MKTTVNFCGNCPFFCSKYNDFDIDNSTTYTCNLSMFLKHENYNILDTDKQKPEWCPLKKEEFVVDFKNFSPERQKDIDLVLKEIEELEYFFDNNEYYHTDFKNPDSDKKEKRLAYLYEKSNELHSNEEMSLNDSILNVDKIKEQILYLDEISIKLQETIKNLGQNN